jgi:hypothetical protein
MGTGVFTDGASALVSGVWDNEGNMDQAESNFGANTVAIFANEVQEITQSRAPCRA